MLNIILFLPIIFGVPASHTKIEALPPPPVQIVIEQIATTTPPLPMAGDCSSFREEVEKYDWNADIVLELARKESGCDPENHNYKDVHRRRDGTVICYGSYGFLNVGCIHYSKGENRDSLELNIEKAYEIYLERGHRFSAWTTCRKVLGCY